MSNSIEAFVIRHKDGTILPRVNSDRSGGTTPQLYFRVADAKKALRKRTLDIINQEDWSIHEALLLIRNEVK